MTREEKITQLRADGFNCAQSTLTALDDITGLDRETALAVCSCFGGGLATGEVCGAVAGAAMALGLAFPFNRPEEPENKKRASTLVRRLIREFRSCHGAVACRELLAKTAPKRCCEEYIRTAVSIVEKIYAEERSIQGGN